MVVLAAPFSAIELNPPVAQDLSQAPKTVSKVAVGLVIVVVVEKYPEGVKFRRLDLYKINKLGWNAKIKLEDGLKEYYKYFQRLYLA